MENSGAIQNQGSLENTGSGRLENIGENAAISGNKPTGDNADVTYQFISGPANYTLGTKKDAVFTLNGSTDQFVDFYIDGARLTKDTDYTVKEGSVIVTVKASVMEKLSTGSHTLKAVYTLGEATGAISVEKQQTQEPAAPSTPTPAPEKANPKTGVAA